MIEVPATDLNSAIESQHGGIATLAQSVPIKERHAGAVVWEGVVHVFDLAGHPTASRAYAWSRLPLLPPAPMSRLPPVERPGPDSREEVGWKMRLSELGLASSGVGLRGVARLGR